MLTNDFFHRSDPYERTFQGFGIPRTWWSRSYEYPWAFGYAKHGATVADMGCGYTFRPFKNALASVAEKVYAVDVRPVLLETGPFPANMEPVVSDVADTPFDDYSLDAIFCISMLEDTGDPAKVIAEFARVLAPGGICVLTFDVPYDDAVACGQYKGVTLDDFYGMVRSAGLAFDGDASGASKEDAIIHKEYNLCCYHAVLKHA